MKAAVDLLAAKAAGSVDVGQVLYEAGMVILIGVVVVFSTLIALTAIFWLFGKVMSRGTKAAPVQKPAVASEPKKMVAPPAPIPASPVVQSGVSEEVVAVIAAAIAAMAPEGTRYAVRSVSRVRGDRPVWANAGLAESTRPF